MNAINVISPYKHHGMWVFDDPRVGLLQEPFVSGADTWIDRVVADITNAEKGFSIYGTGHGRNDRYYRDASSGLHGATRGVRLLRRCACGFAADI